MEWISQELTTWLVNLEEEIGEEKPNGIKSGIRGRAATNKARGKKKIYETRKP